MFDLFTISGKLERILWLINYMINKLSKLKEEAEYDIRVIEQSIKAHNEYISDSIEEISALVGEQERIDRIAEKLKGLVI